MNVPMFHAVRQVKTAARKALGYESWNSDDDQAALVTPAQVIFDIGANIGQTAIRYRSLFPDARIYSFEPDPETFAKLKTALAGDPRVHPVQSAVSDKQGSTPMYIQTHSEVNSLLRPAGDWATTEKIIEVTATTVDGFCEENHIDRIDILKVDAQGSELAVFRGASRIFNARAVRFVFTEVCFDAMYSGMPLFCDLHVELSRHGFRLHGLYSLTSGTDGHVDFGNALYYLE